MEEQLNYGWVLKAEMEYNNCLIQDEKLKEAYLKGINDYHKECYKKFEDLLDKLEKTEMLLAEANDEVEELQYKIDKLKNDF